MSRQKLCVGLTGGIASGKSTVARLFEQRGVSSIDADQVARDVVAPGSEGLKAVIAAFGEVMRLPDGGLNRAAMREHVFNDSAERKRLEAILHPLIRERLRYWRETFGGPYGLLVVPILVEGGFHTLCDRIAVVDVPEEVQIKRLCARDGNSEELARKILAAQATRAERLGFADDVIDNSSDAADLELEVAALHPHYLDLAQSGH